MAPFNLRVKPKYSAVKRHRSSSDDKILSKIKEENDQQLRDAVKYCIDNSCKGYAAKATGRFPLITDARTINRRLLPKDHQEFLETGGERRNQMLLTKTEECELVRFVKNKNRCFKGMTKKVSKS